jgi:hypothetical protein
VSELCDAIISLSCTWGFSLLTNHKKIPPSFDRNTVTGKRVLLAAAAYTNDLDVARQLLSRNSDFAAAKAEDGKLANIVVSP